MLHYSLHTAYTKMNVPQLLFHFSNFSNKLWCWLAFIFFTLLLHTILIYFLPFQCCRPSIFILCSLFKLLLILFFLNEKIYCFLIFCHFFPFRSPSLFVCLLKPLTCIVKQGQTGPSCRTCWPTWEMQRTCPTCNLHPRPSPDPTRSGSTSMMGTDQMKVLEQKYQ